MDIPSEEKCEVMIGTFGGTWGFEPISNSPSFHIVLGGRRNEMVGTERRREREENSDQGSISVRFQMGMLALCFILEHQDAERVQSFCLTPSCCAHRG